MRLTERTERRLGRVAFGLLGLVVLVSVDAFGQQRAVSTGAPSTGAAAQVSLEGAFTSAVEISVEGAPGTDITGSGPAGVVNFGTFDVAADLLTGDKYTAWGANGTFLVATLRVTVRLAGGPTSARVDIQRAGPFAPPLDVPLNNLFYARGTSTWRWLLHPWIIPATQVPASTYTPGAGNLETGLNAGQTAIHQVGVLIPNGQTPGPFSTTVSYTATAN